MAFPEFPKTGYNFIDDFTEWVGLRTPTAEERIMDFIGGGYKQAGQKLKELKDELAETKRKDEKKEVKDKLFKNFNVNIKGLDKLNKEHPQLIPNLKILKRKVKTSAKDLETSINYLEDWYNLAEDIFKADACFYSLSVNSNYLNFAKKINNFAQDLKNKPINKAKFYTLMKTYEALLGELKSVREIENKKIKSAPYPSTCLKVIHLNILLNFFGKIQKYV